MLEGAVTTAGGSWADLGSGTGAFTIALARLMGGTGRILSVDKDGRALAVQERSLRSLFPALDVETTRGDFTTITGVSRLDGIVMANSLHFQRDAQGVLRRLQEWLRPGGKIVIVEYEVMLPNPWVPFPVPFRRLTELCPRAGLAPARLLATRPSRYHGSVYSAVTVRPDGL